MDKIAKCVVSILVAFVVWKISDIIFEIINRNIDIAISQMGNDVTGMFRALKEVVGFLAFDGVSFSLVFLGEAWVIIGIFKERSH